MQLTDYLSECRDLVRDELHAIFPPDSWQTGGLYKLMLEYPLRYGKALRPALSIAVCRALGGCLHAILPSAAVLELYHNAFLQHDDFCDYSESRRGEPTLWRKYGAPIAVNVGDGMLAIAIQPLLDNIERLGLGKALRILQIISRMARESAEGQMIELDWVRSAIWGQTDEEYVRLVYKKSAWYSFVAPVMVGAVAAGLSDIEVSKLGRMTIPLGIAFQIQDDVLNLSADAGTYGKDYCGDLWEGKHTLILIHSLRSASPDDRLRALEILRKRQPSDQCTNSSLNEVKSPEEVTYLRELIDHCQSLGYARDVAQKYANRFQRNLCRISRGWAPSVHRDFLHGLSEFTVRRTH
jgi:geranylgeranyl diphosphate synthase type II